MLFSLFPGHAPPLSILPLTEVAARTNMLLALDHLGFLADHVDLDQLTVKQLGGRQVRLCLGS